MHFGTKSPKSELVDAIRSLPLKLPSTTFAVDLAISFALDLTDEVRKMTQAVRKLSRLRWVSDDHGFEYRYTNAPPPRARDVWARAIMVLLDALESTSCEALSVYRAAMNPSYTIDIAAELGLAAALPLRKKSPSRMSRMASATVRSISKLSGKILKRPSNLLLPTIDLNSHPPRFTSLMSFALGSEVR